MNRPKEAVVLARNILLMAALKELASAATGVELVLLKGAALIELGICSPARRQMTDVDLLVRPEALARLEEALKSLGFVSMPNSSQAWLKNISPNSPPLIFDLHTGLWHVRDTARLWDKSLIGAGGAGLYALNGENLLLHAASHGLLYHGTLCEKDLSDMAAVLAWACGAAKREAFWRRAALCACEYGLCPVVYAALRRLAAAAPESVSAEELALFKPGLCGMARGFLFELAARRHSSFLEYLLPAVFRPELVLKYLFPGREFLRRRYGRSTAAAALLRPFKLLRNALKGNGQ